MSCRKILSILMGALLLGAGPNALAQDYQSEALDELGATFPPATPCPILTLAKGSISGFGMDRPGFTGAELIINSPAAWERFWALHTANIEPPLPTPPVDFRRFVVIAAIQGPQSSGGGPNIAILEVTQREEFTIVRVFDDPRPGMLDVITNPFHVAALPRSCVSPHRSLIIERIGPLPGTSVVQGRVLTATDDGRPRPVPFAHVTLRSASAATDPPISISGFDGTYFFVNVPEGRYVVAARKVGFEPAQEPLGVPPNALVAIDLHLVPHVPETGAIAGRVSTAGAGAVEPVAGALVLLIDPRARPPGIVAETRTNDRGGYGFADLQPQVYRVRVQHPDFLPQAADVEVIAGDTAVRHFLLEPRLHDVGGLTGHVVGVDGDESGPLAGALVRVTCADGTLHRTRTDNQGAFAFDRLPAGQCVVAAFQRGWTPARMPVEIVAGEVTDVRIELTPAESQTGAPRENGVETDLAAPVVQQLEEL